MYLNKRKTILISVLTVAAFLIGFNYDYVNAIVVTKDFFIGLLCSTIAVIYFLYANQRHQNRSNYLEGRISELENKNYENQKLISKLTDKKK